MHPCRMQAQVEFSVGVLRTVFEPCYGKNKIWIVGNNHGCSAVAV